MKKVIFFRKKYPRFVYRDYACKIKGGDLEISFFFETEPDIRFKPKIIIKNVNRSGIKRMGDKALNNLVFSLGLIEMASYWKATCSPQIIVEAGALNGEQINWWKNLIIKGMGQFFYENKIDFTKPNFLKIIARRKIAPKPRFYRFENRYLVPFAGGRDSIVTLEEFKKKKKKIALFTVNTIKRIQRAVKTSGIKKQVLVERVIDKKLLDLNKKGYFNGHTPFTGVLSFISLLCSVIFNYKNIVFSNERSAEEGNLKYLGREINHQWAKSLEFEKMFKFYIKKYMAPGIIYSGYLRKYSEIKISKMFLKNKRYFPVFSSCNAGMKIKSKARQRWCGNCPKCLFIYAALYPYLKERELKLIFGKDIFENKKLLPVMKGMIEKNRTKPFECIGTKKESGLIFKLCLQKAKKSGKIPFLLNFI